MDELKNEEVTSAEESNAVEVEEKSNETSLPEVSDDQLLELLSKKENLEVPVKIDGEESKISFEELRKGYSHQSAASKRMNEANELKQAYQSKIREYDKLLKEHPEEFFKAHGIDIANIYKSKEEEAQKLEQMDPVERQLKQLEANVMSRLDAYENKFQEIDRATEASVKESVKNEFNVMAEKYPVMQDQELQSFAALQMLRNKELTTEQAFKQVSDKIQGMVKSEKENYIASKKEDASKQVLGNSNEVPSFRKNISDIKDVQSRAEAIIANIDKY